jgi:hypothetical protein
VAAVVVVPIASPDTGGPVEVVLVVVAGAAVDVVVAGRALDVVAAPGARVVVADGAVLVVAAWAPVGGVVVVVASVVGTGTTGAGPRPVHTVVVVVEGARWRVVEVLVKVRVTGGAVVGVLVAVLEVTEVLGGVLVRGREVLVGTAAWETVPDVLACALWRVVRVVVGPGRVEVVELRERPALVLVGCPGRLAAARAGTVEVPGTDEVGLDAASSWEARAEISLLCLEIKLSRRAISLWSWARVARCGRVVAGAGVAPPRAPWLACRAWAALST